MVPTDALVRFAQAFAAEHPSVQLVVHTDLLSAVTAHVRGKRAAIGIAGEDADLSELEHRRVTEIRLLPVVAPGHALAKVRGPIGADTLAGSVQIVLSERRDPSEPGSGDRGVFSTQTWRVADLATKHELILGGLGWGHLPEHLVDGDLRRKKLVQLPLSTWGGDVPRYALSLVRRRGARIGPVAQWAEVKLVGLCHEAAS
jgi:DNA-binding transcriptional LysR family regulator